MTVPTQLIFLPGAVGNPQFWQAASERISLPVKRILLGWPWFGRSNGQGAESDLQALVASIVTRLDQPSALIAQSMGGVVAIRAALARSDQVTHLVLAATSGGVKMSDLQVEDWRQGFYEANPLAPRWLGKPQEDLSDALRSLRIPALLLWGDTDPISPVQLGERLHALLPDSRLHIIAGGEHDFAQRFAPRVAALIEEHLVAPR